jgi:hypothetical protein
MEHIYAEFSDKDCPEAWVPRLRFNNAREFEVVDDDIALSALPEGALGPTSKATSFIVATIQGRFTAAMGFDKFPSDEQLLPIEMQLVHGTDALEERVITLQPNCQLTPALIAQLKSSGDDGGSEHLDMVSGWDVVDCQAKALGLKQWDIDLGHMDPAGQPIPCSSTCPLL